MSPKWAPGEAQKGLPESQNEPPEAPGADVIKMSRFFVTPKCRPRGPRNTPGRTQEGPKKGPGGQNVCILHVFYVCFTSCSFCSLFRPCKRHRKTRTSATGTTAILRFGWSSRKRTSAKCSLFLAQRRQNLVETE